MVKKNRSKNFATSIVVFLAVSVFTILAYTQTRQVFSLTTVNTSTAVTVNNTAPSFSVEPFENPASTGTNPTNVGVNITFSATGTDSNGDQYYLAVCKSNSITPNNNAAPSCAVSQTICVSNATNTGTGASCTYAPQQSDFETQSWYGFVCDYSAGSGCSAVSQGAGDSGTPFFVNHAPLLTSVSTDAAIAPGQTMNFYSVAQDNDVDTAQDTVHLVVCSVAGATSSGCTVPGNQLCASGNATTNPTCSYSTPSVFASGNHGYYAYLFDQHGFASSNSPQFGYYAINNATPSISNIVLNGGSPINLNVSTTTAVGFTFTVSDQNGYTDITGISSKLYRTGVGVGASDNTNNHYTLSSCAQSGQTGATADYTCTFNVQFHADPTDVSTTQFYTDTWSATVTATDAGALQATVSATPIELNSLLGITGDASMSYGALNQGVDTGATNQEVTVTSVGNTGVDVQLKGTDMQDGAGHYIPVANQKYSLTNFTYSSGGLALSTTDTLLALHVTKTTVSGTPSNKKIYWGIAIPAILPSGNYSGTNTVTALVSDPLNW